jgi:adenosylmethionine-8-amino-7-oxononanoate aminotransferase
MLSDIKHRYETGTARLDAQAFRERDRRFVWHPWSPLSADRARLMFSRAFGDRVWDVDGKEYIDASSLNTTCGYGHPHVIDAITRQLRTFHGFDLSLGSQEPVGLLAERLAGLLPGQLSKTLFVNSGSEAFEAAIFIASSYWAHVERPRRSVVAFARGYHGSTLISRSLTGLPRVGHPFQRPLPVVHVELPAAPREIRHPDSLAPLLKAFEKALDVGDSDRPMAVVVEPLLNVGGGVVLPRGFLSGLRKLCDEARTLLIIDEVFTGYGRTGRMFACEHEDIEPDILVSSKGLGGGYMPIAAVTVPPRIHDSFAKDPHIGGLRYGHTTSGHAVACAAALATLDVLENERLVDRSALLGRRLLDRLTPLVNAHRVTDVRGLGLIIIIEMESMDAATGVTARAEQAGLLLRQHGENILMVPPLTIADADADTMAERLEQAIREAG